MSGQNQSDKKSEDCKKPVVPDGVKMIAILNYIGFGFMALFSLILVFLGVVLITKSSLNIIEDVTDAGYDILFIMGGLTIVVFCILFICFAMFLFFVGKGLWRLRNWARIACIILGCLGIVFGIKNFIEGLIVSADGYIFLSLLIISFNALIAGYLLFNRKVKEAFS